jgi:SPP1 family predicted phage head-tail adaptor
MKNDRIDIQQITETRSSIGGVSESWATIYQLWADVEQLSGNENYTSDMMIYNDVKKFIIYYNEGQNITAKMRIVYRNENYNITSISHRDRLETTLIAVRYDDE